MHIELNPKSVSRYLCVFVGLLLLANLAGIFTKLYLGHDVVYGLIPLFDFDSEQNIPTLYSSVALMTCAALLFVIARMHNNQGASYAPWIGLALVFIFLSIDEMASIHERLTSPVRSALDTSGLLFFAWVIPYGIACILFLAAYFRFLLNLPKTTMLLFLVAGFTFVLGAIGFELLGGWQDQLHGRANLLYCFLYTCEELFEMFGVIIFIYALLAYITTEFSFLSLTIISNKAKKDEGA